MPALAGNAGFQPAIETNADNDDNQWLVVWQSSGEASGGTSIYGQRIGADVAKVGSLITINSSSVTLNRASVAYDSTHGRFLVVWENLNGFAIEGRVSISW